jgi:hypothetical protein
MEPINRPRSVDSLEGLRKLIGEHFGEIPDSTVKKPHKLHQKILRLDFRPADVHSPKPPIKRQ